MAHRLPIKFGHKLKTGSHTFTLKLFNDSGEQYRRHVQLNLAENAPPPQRNTGGMQDVYCTGDTVTMGVWDHGTQDGDIISLKLGPDIVMTGFDLNACGGGSPGCTFNAAIACQPAHSGQCLCSQRRRRLAQHRRPSN